MSEKKVGKRLLTWVLVLVMTLSLLPLNVLADETAPSDVKIGHYDEGGSWAEGAPEQKLPDGVDSVSKTAVPVGDPKDNTYAVTLQVVLKETTTNVPSQAATVLVIDTSVSMACEKKEHTHSDECYKGNWEDCTPENHLDHWHEEYLGLISYWKHKDEDVGCKDNGTFLSRNGSTTLRMTPKY